MREAAARGAEAASSRAAASEYVRAMLSSLCEIEVGRA